MLDPEFGTTEPWEDACSIEAIHVFLDHDLQPECIGMMEEALNSSRDAEIVYNADACYTVFSRDFSTIEHHATEKCGVSTFTTTNLLTLSRQYLILKSIINWK